MNYTALNALAELDKFPAFKRELGLLLDQAAEIRERESMSRVDEYGLLNRLLSLGGMIAARAKWEIALDSECPNAEILRRAFHNDPKV